MTSDRVAPSVIISIFTIALALRLAYVLGLYFGIGPEALLSQDSHGYRILAQDFIDTGQFNETQIMPLYVLFLAAHFTISNSVDPLFPAITQAGLDALTCVFIAMMAARFSRAMVLPAGLYAALCPTLIVLSGILYTDGPFLFFASAGLLLAMHWFGAPTWRIALMLGLVLGLALSTRVMILPWVVALIVLLPLGAALCGRFKWHTLGHAALVLILALAIQAPIIARNVSQYDSWKLTTQGGAYALLWVVPLVREAADGTPQTEGARLLSEKFETFDVAADPDPFARSAAMSALARDELQALGLGAIAKGWAIGAAINLLAPATILSPPVATLERTGFFETPGDSKLNKVSAFLFHNDSPTYTWVLLVSILGVVLIRLAQLGGLIIGFGRGHRARHNEPLQSPDTARMRRVLLGFLMIWVIYILLINGPIASPKYRLPIEPVGAITFALAVTGFQAWRARRRAQWP